MPDPASRGRPQQPPWTSSFKLPYRACIGAAVLFSASCALVESPAERAGSLARESSFLRVELAGTGLTSFVKGGPAQRLEIYIESDGAPWRLPDEPPVDPTPLRPLVMRLAIAVPSPAVAYLSRPCQYLSEPELAHCDSALWTHGRFREDAVAATNQAIDKLKSSFNATRVDLIGYSGGGAMAALVASRRRDVGCLVTIAAPLDTQAWTTALGVSPLTSSLNPLEIAVQLRAIPQTHFRGGRDKLVPAASTRRFLERAPASVVIDIATNDHICCWAEDWAQLRTQSCLSNF